MTRRGRMVAAYGGAYGAALSLLLWAREPQAAYLGAGLVLALGAGLLAWSAGRRGAAGRREETSGRVRMSRVSVLCALSLIAAASACALLTHRQLHRIDADWQRISVDDEARLRRELDHRLSVLVERGRRASERAAERAGARLVPGDTVGLFADLGKLRERADVAALVVVAPDGGLLAWSGEHHGPLPPAVLEGSVRQAYAERPLFSYLYFSVPASGDGTHAVAAVLLQSSIALPDDEDHGFAERFTALTGARVHFTADLTEATDWRLARGAETVVAGHIELLTQAERHARAWLLGARAVLALVVVGLLILGAGWIHAAVGARRAGTGVPLAALAVALAVAPLGTVGGLDRLFSPMLFLLPMPGDPSLIALLWVLVPLAALVATRRAPRLPPLGVSLAVLLGAVAVGTGFAGGVRLLLGGATPQLLGGGFALWGVFQITSVLLLAILPGLAFPMSDREETAKRPLIAAGAGLSLLLGLAVLARWKLVQEVDPWTAALWAVPFMLFAAGLAPLTGRNSLLVRWLAAGWLAATAVIPHLWLAHLDTRFQTAERELATLGARVDPYVESLLRRFGDEARERSAQGETGVELLYRSWLASGLARQSVPVEVALWSPEGEAVVHLGLGGQLAPGRRSEPLLGLVSWTLARARDRGEPVVETARDAPGINQILAVPLGDGRLISVITPPRRTLGHSTVLAPLLGDEPRVNTRLTLVPVKSEQHLPPGVVRWTPTERGWRSETVVRYPEGEYHAHLELRISALPVLVARALLLLFTDLAVLGLIWLAGRFARGVPPEPQGGWRGWLGSFRARVTFALFGFFLIPTVGFGVVAYRALAGEVARTATGLAEHAVGQASTMFPDSVQDLGVVARRVGEEVLYYHGGELLAASAVEAADLGLYGAWMPPGVFQTLRTGEESTASQLREIGQHHYVVAYSGATPGGAVAVPVSLEAGEVAVRQRELTDLILFATLVGALLSLALSVSVGHALAGPIGQLRRASSAVGSGRLGVRLPEERSDEFGELFRSFNRMTRRLRRARAREARTQRVLAWGEMARQVAHEIKNPLTPIKLSVQHLRRAYGDGRPDFEEILDTNVEQILKEIDRLSEIARAFSRYGAPPEAAGPPQAVDVGVTVSEVLTLYRSGDDGIRFVPGLDPGLPPVLARPGELKEVLINLFENARAALRGSGVIGVVARQVDDFVELTVEDDGTGIPEELIPRIFDPHFSTSSSGTGLGLAIVRRIVESWGGAVSAESREGQGTAIRIRLRPAEVGVEKT